MSTSDTPIKEMMAHRIYEKQQQPHHTMAFSVWKSIKQWIGQKITLTIKQLTKAVQKATKNKT